jgi:DNA primase
LAGFTEESVQRVRDAADIVSVVETYTTLKRAGATYKALCPFHDEKTPSFTVNPEMQIYKCFGCGEGGDVFRFVMKIEGLNFPEAVEALAERTGVELERRQRADAPEQPSHKKALLWVLSKSMAWFEDRLADPHSGAEAMEYLLQRGFSREIIRAWRLGWAPPRSGELTEHLIRESGGKRAEVLRYAVEAGVLRQGEDGDTYEFFRGRIMFPILDLQGRAVGFGGRILREDPARPVGKYVNTPETPLFSKSRVLYGLHAAAKEIRLSRTAVVVEGYTDVIMCHQHGLRNVVATLGTALTRDHVRLLRRHAETVVARFDDDEAGAKATDRAIRTFVAEDMPLRVIRSEGIKDACEFLPQRGPEAFLEEMEEAEDAFSYHLRRELQSQEPRSIDEKEAAVRQAMEVVNLSPNAMKREMLRRQVAALAGVPEATLPQPTQKRERSGPSPEAGSAATVPAQTDADTPEDKSGPSRPASPLEVRLVEYMLHSRAWCDRVCSVLPPEDFGNELLREAASELHDAWNETDSPQVNALLGRIQHPDASRLLADLQMQDRPPLAEAELEETLCRVRRQRLEEEWHRLRQEIQAAQAAGDARTVRELSTRIPVIRRDIDRLSRRESDTAVNGPAA